MHLGVIAAQHAFEISSERFEFVQRTSHVAGGGQQHADLPAQFEQLGVEFVEALSFVREQRPEPVERRCGENESGCGNEQVCVMGTDT